jgi:hypothetical protein
MDLMTASLAGLVSIGVVNVVDMFYPLSDSRVKFAVAFVSAFAVLFIPMEFQNLILDKARIAIEVALASSGAYKLFQVAGTK